MKRVITGQIMHESSSVASKLTEEENFRRTLIWFEGEDVWKLSDIGMKDFLTGIMEKGKNIGLDIKPCFCTFASPSGIISKKCFQSLQEHFFAGICEDKPIDGFCLALHGAGVSEITPDLEGYTLKKIRKKYGKEVPVIVTLDPHANITQKMIDNATLLIPSKLYPHTDTYETGMTAAELMQGLLYKTIHPVQYIERLPILLPLTKGSTYENPMKSVLDLCEKAEQQEGVLHCSFAQGFPYSDIAECGASVVVTTDGNPHLAKEIAKEISAYVMQHLDDFRSDAMSVEEGLDLAQQMIADGTTPIVMNEISDNPGAGTPGDGTWLLRAMLSRNIEKSCIASIVDPQVVKAAVESGVGSTLTVTLGGKTEAIHGEPVTLEHAYVKCICDGKYNLLSPMTHGQPVNYGTTVRLICGNVDIIVAEYPFQIMDEGLLKLLGIDFKKYNLTAVKSAVHFRAYFRQYADAILTVDPPGLSTGNLDTLHLKHVKRPIFPLD